MGGQAPNSRFRWYAVNFNREIEEFSRETWEHEKNFDAFNVPTHGDLSNCSLSTSKNNSQPSSHTQTRGFACLRSMAAESAVMMVFE
jgi:hypothetical protein